MAEATQVNLPWTSEVPTQPGMYLYKSAAEWVWHIYRVERGQWQLRQDPDRLYVSGDRTVGQLYIGNWCGPLAEPR